MMRNEQLALSVGITVASGKAHILRPIVRRGVSQSWRQERLIKTPYRDEAKLANMHT